MTRSRIFAGTPGHRPAFALGGWVMLLVVLLCAAPSGAQPRTRLVGSAFDPATVSVAVSPKQPKLSAAAKKSPRRDPLPTLHAEPPLAAALAEHALPVGFAVAAPRAEARQPGPARAPQRRLTRPLGTRAPPRG